jgi:hypothetical protein
MNRTRNRAGQPLKLRCAPLIFPPLRSAAGSLASAAALALLLSGCAADEQARTPARDEALIHVRLVDHIDYKPGTHAFGLSRCANGVCTVEILRDHYPYCLDHELRHVFEGDWHAGHETVEGC